MLKQVATCILVVTFFTAVITPVFGHQQWILPNFFYTNDESPWLGIEHTSGDQRFVSGHGLGSPFMDYPSGRMAYGTTIIYFCWSDEGCWGDKTARAGHLSNRNRSPSPICDGD